MKRLCAFLLLLACAPAAAQDSLLERLDAELQGLAARIEPALVKFDSTVTITNTHSTVFTVRPQGTPERTRVGVVVGSPARVVLPWAWSSPEMTLASGMKVRRIGGDEAIGIAVMELPSGVKVAGVPVSTTRDVARGTLALQAAGDALSLVVVRGMDDERTSIVAEQADAPLFDSRGALLGLPRVGGAVVRYALRPQVVMGSDGPAGKPIPQGLTDEPFNVVTYLQPASETPGDHFIPGWLIARVLQDLEEAGRIRRAYLGVILGAADGGVALGTVLPDSPADLAGLKSGRRITAIDGAPVLSVDGFTRQLLMRRPGETVRLTVDGHEVAVELGELGEGTQGLRTPESLGIDAVDLTPELRAFVGVPGDVSGVLVRSATGPAHAAGLRRGHVISGGGGGRVADVEELRAVVAGAKAELDLSVYTGKTWDMVHLKLEDSPSRNTR